DRLRRGPGIGPATAVTLVADLPEPGPLDRKGPARPWGGSPRATATQAPCAAGAAYGVGAPA
ncbi:MAG TPA: hypothetical protein VGS80_21760, partial [Ktedonobacterales bacterium]|nr:hypothetical protein [Ktedonobacterales bacterium]